ncbi:hypothetical protein [Actinoplanes sp. NBRC 101535]|uniref:hypothetical protein n=1 Tax=Actinoplanes sp. NBRC 101535 TaxID=3032196 RepID=UPI0024A31FED|nr:hypothetical protein [Actinoplanes sp. NBRC 101535]GLY02433.1 hypothetical protein Acsp01_28120 [Actinoplanes sp. NBRC 101535]
MSVTPGGTDAFDTAMTNAAAFLARSLSSLLSTTFAELNAVKSPDIATEQFLSTYAAGSGIAIFVLVVMLARLFHRTSSGQMSGQQLADSLWRWAPGAMLLVLFGPALGQLTVQLTDAATTSIVRYFSAAVASLPDRLTTMVVIDDPAKLPGGPIVALLVMAVAFVGVGGLVGGLVIQTLALYLTGAVMAVAFVATIDPATRGRALRLPSTWLGLLFAKPLLFFLIGALARILDPAPGGADEGWGRLMPALMGALALLFVGVAPWSLIRATLPLPSAPGSRAGQGSGVPAGAIVSGGSSTMLQLSYRRLHGSLTRHVDEARPAGPHRPRPAMLRPGRDRINRIAPADGPGTERPVAFSEQAIDNAPPPMPDLVHRGEP